MVAVSRCGVCVRQSSGESMLSSGLFDASVDMSGCPAKRRCEVLYGLACVDQRRRESRLRKGSSVLLLEGVQYLHKQDYRTLSITMMRPHRSTGKATGICKHGNIPKPYCTNVL